MWPDFGVTTWQGLQQAAHAVHTPQQQLTLHWGAGDQAGSNIMLCENPVIQAIVLRLQTCIVGQCIDVGRECMHHMHLW